MEFVVFFLISWFTIFLFRATNKHIPLLEGTIIYLIILIVSINFSWIVMEELKFITITKEQSPYTSFILNRSIIIPLLMLIQLNFVCMFKKRKYKATVLLITVFLLNSLSWLSISLNIIEYKKWNVWYESSYYLFLCLVSLLLFQILNKSFRDVLKTNDSLGKL